METNVSSNFIHKIIEQDIEEGGFEEGVYTRFPPEPNGYLHIGSAYAININYSAAKKYNGKFNLRFDDTNPEKEDMEFVESIKADMKWLGYDFGDRVFYGSDYFEKLYDIALNMIKKNKAYVCDLSPEEIREYRGTLTEPGKESPYRNRSVEENLALFEKMKKGEFEAGSKVLRAKIDMASPNMNMRDPVMYRIQFAEHYRRGNKWCIYPMYDYAHPLQDAIEGITHSLCSIEFKDHRPLYEWFLKEAEIENPPKQREFGRMNLRGVVTSKRYLRELVFGGYVDGWDDPRLPTIQGLRRRGYTPEAIKSFLGEIGVSKSESVVDVTMLEQNLRQDLKEKVPCVMAVLRPIKVVITNYPEDKEEWIEVPNNFDNEEMGSRKIPFSKVIYIEQEDFMENPPRKYFRLTPNQEVRLKNAYIIKCNEVIKDEATGEIVELHCTYDAETSSTRKVKGTIHWVSQKHAIPAEARLYDSLLLDEDEQKEDAKDWKENLSKTSLEVLEKCYVEPSLKAAELESKYQFLRLGYFTVDNKYTTKDKLVFNRIVPLRSSFKIKK